MTFSINDCLFTYVRDAWPLADDLSNYFSFLLLLHVFFSQHSMWQLLPYKSLTNFPITIQISISRRQLLDGAYRIAALFFGSYNIIETCNLVIRYLVKCNKFRYLRHNCDHEFLAIVRRCGGGGAAAANDRRSPPLQKHIESDSFDSGPPWDSSLSRHSLAVRPDCEKHSLLLLLLPKRGSVCKIWLIPWNPLIIIIRPSVTIIIQEEEIIRKVGEGWRRLASTRSIDDGQ